MRFPRGRIPVRTATSAHRHEVGYRWGVPPGRYRHDISSDHEACPVHRHGIRRRARVAGLTVTKVGAPIGPRDFSATKFLAAVECDKVSACQKLAAQACGHPPSPKVGGVRDFRGLRTHRMGKKTCKTNPILDTAGPNRGRPCKGAPHGPVAMQDHQGLSQLRSVLADQSRVSHN